MTPVFNFLFKTLLYVSLISPFFFSSRRRHTRSVSAFLLNRSSDLNGNKTTNLTSKEAKMGKVMRHTLGASLNIRHNLSSSKGPKPLQLKLLTTYIPKTSAFTLAFSTSQRLRTTRASADRKSGSAGMPRPISYAVFCLKKKKTATSTSTTRNMQYDTYNSISATVPRTQA